MLGQRVAGLSDLHSFTHLLSERLILAPVWTPVTEVLSQTRGKWVGSKCVFVEKHSKSNNSSKDSDQNKNTLTSRNELNSNGMSKRQRERKQLLAFAFVCRYGYRRSAKVTKTKANLFA